MKINEMIEKLGLSVITQNGNLEFDVTRGYASDMLSDVMANAREGDLWITMQTHQNIAAVSVLKSIAGIVLVNGRQPDDDTLKKANEEDLPILSTDMSTFEIAGRLYEMGLKGK